MANPLDPVAVKAASKLAGQLMDMRTGDKTRLDRLFHYRQHGHEPGGIMSDQRILGLPLSVPEEVRTLAKSCRVNLLRYVVSARVQDMYVDGFQTQTSPDNVPGWDIWQANQLDARQIGVHRAALTFGVSYAVVLPGRPAPVIRGVSPRDMTAAWGDDDVWPAAVLWKMRGNRWRMIDATTVWEMRGDEGGMLRITDAALHGQEFCPVVRFRDTIDLDQQVEGVVEPLIQLQDQINITSFGLHVAQHFGAFRQRYILGWLADSEAEALKTGASRLMMFEDEDVKVGEFGQTDLRGYIESREATIRHMATVSQTPVHELMGQFVNISADALEAARASHHAAVEENQISCGESWEQVLSLASSMADKPVEDSASVIWRDTTVRSMTEAATALGLLAEKLGVPPKALWSRVPNVSQHELDQWKAMADEPGAFDDLMMLLTKQTAKVGPPDPDAAAPVPTPPPPGS